ncbi:MAG: electron transport complex subunit RsxC [Methylococcales symbiont of Hymedesmia sp. n. MRB-2018]|nr:MAG: electron transport complex subunit RsxC [Methylococcales symbiont of Hymedesmia sp. n. MRB-2018]
MNLFNLFGKKTFPKGIHPEGFKEETHDHQARRLPFAHQIILPLSQNIGKPAIPIVHIGQQVQRGEVIAKADGFMSVPLHASVSGSIKKIDLVPNARGNKEQAIIINTALSSAQTHIIGSSNDFASMSRKDLIQAVQNTGMVGLGGASFPTHVKMNIPDDCDIHTILINGCECEPFLTTDHRIMLEQIEFLIHGIYIAMKAVNAPKAIIGVEDNKLNVLEAIQPHLPADGSISIEAVVTKYPQGAEKMLVYSLLGMEIPSGKLPSSIGVAIFNVATLAAIGELLPHSQGLIERIVTITGDDLNKPGNYMVPLGTPLSHILEYAEFTGNEAELVLGGPMMGMPAGFLDTPVKKGTGAVLVLNKRATKHDDILPCIKCTQCLQVCPINLNPSELGMLATKRRYDVMEENYHLNDCFECGCCSYVCPSNIPLVQYFRIAKTLNHERHIMETN